MGIPAKARRVCIAAGTILGTTALVLWGLSTIYTARASAFYSAALKETPAEIAISLNGKRYTVKDGAASADDGSSFSRSTEREILALSYAYILARNAPIASITETDAPLVAQYARELEGTAEAIASRFKGADAELVKNGLYPHRFLSALSTAEIKRRTFLSSPSWRTYADYTDAISATLSFYVQDLEAYRSAFKRFVPAGTEPYATFSGVVSTSSVLAALSDMASASHEQRSRIEDRISCVRGVLWKCHAGETRIEFHGPSSAGDVQPIPQVVEDLANGYMQVHGFAEEYADIVRLDASACAEKRNGPNYFSPPHTDERTNAPLMGGLADDLYFYRSSEYVNVPRATTVAYLRSKGIEFIRYNPVYFYTCAHIGDDASRQYGTIAAIRSFGEDTGRIFSEHEARTLTFDALHEGNVEAFDVALQLDSGTAGFASIVRQVAFTMKTYLELEHKGIPLEDSMAWFLFGKSGFPTLFAVDNKTLIPRAIDVFDSRIDNPGLGKLIRWSDLSAHERDRALRDLPAMLEFHLDGLI